MAETILTACPFCGKPHTVSISTFESSVAAPPAAPLFSSGFWSSEAGVNLMAVLAPASATWFMCWLYGWPAWISPAVGVLAGVGLPVLKLFLSRPLVINPKADRVSLDVVITDTSEGGFTRSIDAFNPDLVTYDDLVKLARAERFSRAAAAAVGLSQAKWHKIVSEFLRLNYAVPLPNNQNGYYLTLRGAKLREKLRDVNKQQQTTRGL